MNFEVVQAEKMYQGRAFDVEKVTMRLPDGAVRPYDLVRHKDSVSIVPLDEQGNILFVRQYRIGTGETLLELPAGVMEDGEEALSSAEREIREETGMGAREMKALGDYYLAPGYCNERMVAFLATGLYPDRLAHDVDEFLEVEALPAARAYELAFSGGIRDSKSLAALLLARPHIFPPR